MMLQRLLPPNTVVVALELVDLPSAAVPQIRSPVRGAPVRYMLLPRRQQNMGLRILPVRSSIALKSPTLPCSPPRQACALCSINKRKGLRTLPRAQQHRARVAHVRDHQLLPDQHGGDCGAAVVAVLARVRLQVPLVCVHERLLCSHGSTNKLVRQPLSVGKEDCTGITTGRRKGHASRQPQRLACRQMRKAPEGAPIAVLMSEVNLLFASKLSNRLACTKAAAFEPPWPAPHISHSYTCSQGPGGAERQRKHRSSCTTRGVARTIKHAKQPDHLATVGVLSELRGSTVVGCNAQTELTQCAASSALMKRTWQLGQARQQPRTLTQTALLGTAGDAKGWQTVRRWHSRGPAGPAAGSVPAHALAQAGSGGRTCAW